MFNNKGQSLVAFLLIIPIILILLIVVVDVGRMYLLRQELDNINYIAIDYGICNNNNDSQEEIINKINEIVFVNDMEIKIISNRIEDNKIYLETEKDYQGYFLGLINKKFIKIKSKYVGYFVGEKKYIERVK